MQQPQAQPSVCQTTEFSPGHLVSEAAGFLCLKPAPSSGLQHTMPRSPLQGARSVRAPQHRFRGVVSPADTGLAGNTAWLSRNWRVHTSAEPPAVHSPDCPPSQSGVAGVHGMCLGRSPRGLSRGCPAPLGSTAAQPLAHRSSRPGAGLSPTWASTGG